MNKYETSVRRSAFTPAPLTAKQEKAWVETRAAFLWSCPAFSHILYTMLNPGQSEHIASFTTEVPIAATDGVQLLLNPDEFFKYTLSERIFIIAHEVMHCVYDHCGQAQVMHKRQTVTTLSGKSMPYDADLMNRALDYVVNDLLIKSDVGKYNRKWLHDPTIGTSDDSAIEVYARMYEDQDGKGGANGQEGFDQHLAPATSQGNDRNEIEWKQAVAAGSAAAKAQGKLPAALERAFGELLNPAVCWRDKVEAFFARKVGSGSYDWRRQDRRMTMYDFFSPMPSGRGCGTIAVAVDTSGSIAADPKIIDMFFAELSGILDDLNPARMVVLWCDAEVHRVDEIQDAQDLKALRAKPVPGWGGTAFEPVFKRLEDDNIVPDALVYLTDGEGSFPSIAPSYPVLWGNISQYSKYPFGDVVDIPV